MWLRMKDGKNGIELTMIATLFSTILANMSLVLDGLIFGGRLTDR